MLWTKWGPGSRAVACAVLAAAVVGCDDEPVGNGGLTGLGSTTTGGSTGDTTSTPVDAGTSTTGSSAPVKSNLPCDVQDIVYEHCLGCHSDPPQGTFMPLLTHAHFHAASYSAPERAYYEVAKDRLNAGVGNDPMPPTGASTLSAEELATLNAWIDAGAPASDATCAGGGDVLNPDAGGGTDGGGTDGGPGDDEIECIEFRAHSGDKVTPYHVGTANDYYVNMTFTAPWQETVYGVTINPIIDNGPVLHHWLLYREPGGGIDGAVVPGNGQHAASELMHGWAPGGSALDFTHRGDVGMEMPPGTYLMEFHYNSADPNAKDASGAEVCFKRRKPEHVATMSWLGLDHGYESYIAGGIGFESGNCTWPSDNWVGTCDPISNEPIHLLVVWPHMHEAGVRMRAVINGPNGERVLHDDAFDFDYQKSYEVEEVLMPGETITTTCEYSKPSCAGQATTAEMCYLYTYAWPPGALRDLGPWGAFAHGNNVCLGQ